MDLGSAMLAVRGPAATEVTTVYGRARALAERLDVRGDLLHVACNSPFIDEVILHNTSWLQLLCVRLILISSNGEA